MTRGLVAAVLVACHAPSATADPAPTASSSAAALPTPTAPTYTTAPLPAATIDASPPASYLFDESLASWLAAHDVKPPKELETWGSCTIARADVLFCRGAPMESLSGGESVFPLRVVYAHTGVALTTPIAAGPLDNPVMPGQNADDFQYVILDASLDPAGTTLTIQEKPGATCAQILAQYKEPESAGHRRVVQRACTARGRYVLQNGKLVRAP